MKLKLLVVGLVLTTGGGAFGAPKDAKKEKKPVVSVMQTQAAELFDELSYPARITSRVNAMVVADGQGAIEKLFVNLGSKVKKGDVVAKIRHTDPAFRYRAQNVVAPVDGVVARTFVTEGGVVSKGERILELIGPGKVKILIEIPVGDLSYLNKEAKGALKVSHRKDTVPVSILGISPFVDPATGTATSELQVEREDVDLISLGPLGKVTFKTNIHKGIEVPEHAVAYKGRDTVLGIVTDGKYKRVKIKLGEKRRGKVEILAGLKADQTVVLRSNQFIKDGQEVEVQK